MERLLAEFFGGDFISNELEPPVDLMPRANRYIQPGCLYHLTHRCHNRSFLLKFALHRTEYCRRLRDAVAEFKIALFNYALTSNHVHLLALARSTGDISRFMHKLQGRFAVDYNRRKHRSGAFWEERYHATMVGSGEHLLNCLCYIDMNMVRAGVVRHPEEWRWCGYHELVGGRERYRILDVGRLSLLLGLSDSAQLAEMHQAAVAAAIEQERMSREAIWTEAIAVGSEAFVRMIAGQTKRRKRLRLERGSNGAWYVRERAGNYGLKMKIHNKRRA